MLTRNLTKYRIKTSIFKTPIKRPCDVLFQMDFCSRNLTSYDRPNTMEIIVPPVMLTLLIIAGIARIEEKYIYRKKTNQKHRSCIMTAA